MRESRRKHYTNGIRNVLLAKRSNVMFMNKNIRGKKRKEIFEIIKKAKRISLKEIKASTNINYNTVRSSVIGLTKLD